MKLDKKITDFILLEEGSIGHKAAVSMGALLATGVLGAVLASPADAATCHCDVPAHYQYHWQGIIWYQMHGQAHYNVTGTCPLPC